MLASGQENVKIEQAPFLGWGVLFKEAQWPSHCEDGQGRPEKPGDSPEVRCLHLRLQEQSPGPLCLSVPAPRFCISSQEGSFRDPCPASGDCRQARELVSGVGLVQGSFPVSPASLQSSRTWGKHFALRGSRKEEYLFHLSHFASVAIMMIEREIGFFKCRSLWKC